MAFWPFASPRGSARLTEVSSYAASWPSSVLVTASATLHTKGTYGVLIASTAAPWKGFWLGYTQIGVSNAISSILADISFGPATELVQVANLNLGNKTVALNTDYLYIPLYVPTGTRITIRHQSGITNKAVTYRVQGVLADSSVAGASSYGKATNYGADTANSRGVTTTGGASNTLGAWAILSASTTDPIHAITASVGNNNAGTIGTAATCRLQIGVGGAGVESPVAECYFSTATTELVHQNGLGFTAPFEGLNIAPGSRLVARIASSLASQVNDVSVIGYSQGGY